MTSPITYSMTAPVSRQNAASELEDVETLMRLYQAKVLRFVVFSLGDRDAAQTITQDCFLKAHTTRSQFRGECSVATWLMRIAYNLVRDHTKSLKFKFWKSASQSAVDVRELASYLQSEASSPEEQALARERVGMIRETVKEFSEKQRTVFLMRFVEDLDLPEIAEITGMPVQTVKTHLYRAVGAVRKKFGVSA